MQPIARLEEHLARWLGAPSSRLLRGRLHPVQLAQYLCRAMEQEAAVGVTQSYAPDAYRVGLHAEDIARYAGLASALEQELAHFLLDAAHERGLALRRRPQVRLESDRSVRRGEPKVTAAFTDGTDQEPSITETEVLAVRLRLPDGLLVDVDHLPWRLGRALDNETVIEDRRTSRNHARLRLTRGRLCVEDLGSTHGTRLNGERVTTAFLEPGDRLTLGGAEIVIVNIDRTANPRGEE